MVDSIHLVLETFWNVVGNIIDIEDRNKLVIKQGDGKGKTS